MSGNMKRLLGFEYVDGEDVASVYLNPGGLVIFSIHPEDGDDGWNSGLISFNLEDFKDFVEDAKKLIKRIEG